jgi:hypothetical protein
MVNQMVVRFSPRSFVRVQRQRLAPVDLIAPPATVPQPYTGLPHLIMTARCTMATPTECRISVK